MKKLKAKILYQNLSDLSKNICKKSDNWENWDYLEY